jgi:alkaline phosphatase D
MQTNSTSSSSVVARTAPSLPPKSFDPVAVEFVTGSVSAPGLFESAEYNVAEDHPLRAVYLYKPSSGAAVQPAMNFSMMHGVRASLCTRPVDE